MAWHPSDGMDENRCTHCVLARGAVAQVEYCTSHGVLHLAIDSLSIRFRPTALRDLRDTLTAALATYERAQRLACEPDPRAPRDGTH